MRQLRLRPSVDVAIRYDDRTAFGSPVGGRPDVAARTLLGDVVDPSGAPGALASIAKPTIDGWTLHDSVLYPCATDARPAGLRLYSRRTGQGVQASVPSDLWPAVHDLVSALSGTPDQQSPGGREIDQIVAEAGAAGLIELADRAEPRSGISNADITFVGHATVVVRSATHAVIIDPFLPSPLDACSPYLPLRVSELGPIDAILLTHSHPDHFNPATLLSLDSDTPVVVPTGTQETLLSVDMSLRLRELGFTAVTPIPWWRTFSVGDILISALPFYGEQPATDEVLHPEVRNAGNTYLVRTPSVTTALLADSGRDPSGDVTEVAKRCRSQFGPADLVFCGYRGWRLRPPELLSTSVARYLLFVPPKLWELPQQLMCDATDAVAVAEELGAVAVVPYAAGGAPWFWDRGLGPRLDGAAREQPRFDPFPERVVAEADRRGIVRPLLLRPGDSILWRNHAPQVIRIEGRSWPFQGAGPSEVS